jgi:hypothetical protein
MERCCTDSAMVLCNEFSKDDKGALSELAYQDLEKLPI